MSSSPGTLESTTVLPAQRSAIEHALREVHWNRCKAAVSLGVTYKTLLNKIKECGLSGA